MPEGPQGRKRQSPLALRLAFAAVLLAVVACNLLQVKPGYMNMLIGSAFILAMWNVHTQRS